MLPRLDIEGANLHRKCINGTHAGEGTLHHSHGLGVLAIIRGVTSSDGYGSDLLEIVCCQTVSLRVLEMPLGLTSTLAKKESGSRIDIWI